MRANAGRVRGIPAALFIIFLIFSFYFAVLIFVYFDLIRFTPEDHHFNVPSAATDSDTFFYGWFEL